MAYSVEKADIQFKLGSATHMATIYQEKISQTGSLTAQKEELRQKIQAAKAKVEDLKSAAETYERDFLDRRQNPQTKKTTLQDIVLGTFFIGYLLFALGVVIYVFMSYAPKALDVTSNNPVLRYSMTFFSLIGMTVFGLFIAELIRRYA